MNLLSKKNLPIEAELLFLLSRLDIDVSEQNRIESIISNIDWDYFTPITTKHGVSAIIFKNLLKLKNIPQDILIKFEHIYNNCLRSNILMAAEIDQVVDTLSSKGIEVIILKGPITSEKIFGDIGLYPSGDIDILVKVKNIERVIEILRSEGYRLRDTGFDEYRDYYVKELYHISMSNGKYVVEPHWNLFMRYFTTPPDFWWEEISLITSGERQYRFLSPEKNILYNSFRLFYKGFTPLRFLVFISAIIQHYKDEIDWKKLFDYAKKYQFENVLRVTLKLTHELLNTPVPQEFSNIKGARGKILYAGVTRLILKAEDIHPLTKLVLAFLRDDLKGIFRIFLHGAFPSMGEIVSRYKLTPGTGKAVAYYLLNPMLILLRKHRG